MEGSRTDFKHQPPTQVFTLSVNEQREPAKEVGSDFNRGPLLKTLQNSSATKTSVSLEKGGPSSKICSWGPSLAGRLGSSLQQQQQQFLVCTLHNQTPWGLEDR